MTPTKRQWLKAKGVIRCEIVTDRPYEEIQPKLGDRVDIDSFCACTAETLARGACQCGQPYPNIYPNNESGKYAIFVSPTDRPGHYEMVLVPGEFEFVDAPQDGHVEWAHEDGGVIHALKPAHYETDDAP